MTIYNEAQIHALYLSSLKVAIQKVKQIKVFCGNNPSFTGLSGWVFEQTIQYCIKRELKARKVRLEVMEQAKLKAHIKADLKIGKAAIEVKQSGLFATAAIVKYGE